MAQKDYDKKVLRSIEKELKAIKLYLSNYPQICAEQIGEHMHPDRRKLIRPIRETDEVYIRKWDEISYEGRAFSEYAPEYYPSKGERVRSKSEVLIAIK